MGTEAEIYGRHNDHWHQAEREVNARESSFSTAAPVGHATGLQPVAPQAGTEQQDVPPAGK